MLVKVKSYAILREIIGKESLRIIVDKNATVLTVLEDLVDRYGERLEKEIFNEAKTTLREYVAILLNGKNIQYINGLDTQLNHEDQLVILPILRGG